MVVTHDPRPPYREDIRDNYLPPSRTMLDTASAFWKAVIAALAVTVLTWVVYVTLTGPGVPSVDPTAKPVVETQPITPPAPVPATRPAPTP
jgi:hypothetical protein